MFLCQHSEHIALPHDEIFLSIEFEFSTTIFAIEHFVALFEHHLLVFCAMSNGNNLSAKRFFFCCVGDDDSANFLLSRCRNYEHAVC